MACPEFLGKRKVPEICELEIISDESITDQSLSKHRKPKVSPAEPLHRKRDLKLHSKKNSNTTFTKSQSAPVQLSTVGKSDDLLQDEIPLLDIPQ